MAETCHSEFGERGVLLLSACDHLRFTSFVNHKIFASLNSASYAWSFILKRPGLRSQRQKPGEVRSFLGMREWLLWIDDDVYFTDFSWRLTPWLQGFPGLDLLICKSPLNETGGWTYINSGVFFLRSSMRSTEFLDAAIRADPAAVKEWWSAERYGIFTATDQDAFTYVLATDPRFTEGDFWVRLDSTECNSRYWQYENAPDDHRVLHILSSIKSKQQVFREFAARFGCNEFLVPDELLREYDLSAWTRLPDLLSKLE